MSKLGDDFVLDASSDEASRICRSAVATVGWNIKSIEPRRIVPKVGVGLTRWPSKIEILLSEAGDSHTTVTLHGSIGGVGPLQKSHLRGQMNRLRNAIEVAAPKNAITAWLNDLAARLADRFGTETVFGFGAEKSYYTGSHIKGVPIEADVRVKGSIIVSVGLFGNDELAQEAEQALMAELPPGRSLIATVGRVLCIAHSHEQPVSEARFEDVIRAVSEVPVPVSEPKVAAEEQAPQTDSLEQLRRLGQLRDACVVSDEEFESKKRELLDRI